jgi:hypothetical protein
MGRPLGGPSAFLVVAGRRNSSRDADRLERRIRSVTDAVEPQQAEKRRSERACSHVCLLLDVFTAVWPIRTDLGQIGSSLGGIGAQSCTRHVDTSAHV